MYKRSNTRDDSRFRRPDANSPQDSWEEQPPVYSGRPMDEREEPYPEIPYEELPEGFYDEELPPEEPEIIATNGTVKLTCLLAAFCSLLALFFLFAEKRRDIISGCQWRHGEVIVTVINSALCGAAENAVPHCAL